MIEKIYVYLCLLRAGFIDDSTYDGELDKLFMQNPESELLLELEFLSGDIEKSWTILHQYCIRDNHTSYDYLQFGKVLFSHLEEVYNSNQMELREFAKRAYDVWYMLPTHIYENDMFWVLNHADDYLSIGDEKSARELYEKAFSYYKGK